MDLAGKVALVTGGGTGIGKAISLALARGGANVAVNYSRSEDDAVATAHEVESIGVRGIAVQADVSRAEDVDAMVGRVVEELGRLDLLVNNAGMTVFVPFPDLLGIEEAAWDQIMAVNVKAPFLCSRAAAEPMRRAGGGSIVIISSVAGIKAGGSSVAYAVSKAGVIHLTKCLAIALAPDIRVNSVAPGFVRTRWGERFSEEQKQRMEQNAPLRRGVAPEEIATATLECLRNDAMTGQTVVVDAGLLL
jgi:3-oxoacyl-[acyl-carrier protein] reductase